MSWKEHTQSNTKIQKTAKKMKPKPLFFITFYNLNPLFGLFSSFWVWWKIQCKLPPKTKRFCPLVLK